MKLYLRVPTTSCFKRWCSAVFLLLFSHMVSAQTSYAWGLLPAINLNKGFENKWNLNFTIESRQFVQKGIFNQAANSGYTYELTDFSTVLSKNIGLQSFLGGGYTLRIRDQKAQHRSIQQFTVVSKLNNQRLSHRFSSDQTFFEDDKPEFRARYRIGSEIPLNGQSADVDEFYLKLSNELLNSWQDQNYDLENRLATVIGYKFSDTNKFEVGLDYRIDGFIDGFAEHVFWVRLNWYVKI
ncbi:MAG: DUF2490 domain-containing protein [Flavobacteriaceae bacterium]|nr:DUF2490 domain-containing protein [Flavobacteriaceae bacterium]